MQKKMQKVTQQYPYKVLSPSPLHHLETGQLNDPGCVPGGVKTELPPRSGRIQTLVVLLRSLLN